MSQHNELEVGEYNDKRGFDQKLRARMRVTNRYAQNTFIALMPHISHTIFQTYLKLIENMN